MPLISYHHDLALPKRLFDLSFERGSICCERNWARWKALEKLHSVGMGFVVGVGRGVHKLEHFAFSGV